MYTAHIVYDTARELYDHIVVNEQRLISHAIKFIERYLTQQN